MSDSVYRPISDSDEESETHATTDQPVASWSDFRKELEDQANVDRSELTPEEGAAEVTRRRQEAATPENASERPIVRLKSKGPAQTLREASQDLSFTRGIQMRDELLAAGHTEEELQRRGTEMLAAAERGDPRDPPPAEVKLTDKWGEPEDGPLSADEAAHKIGEWRQEQARQRAAELQELTGEQARQQEQAQQAEQQAQPAQPEPEQPDPVQQERQQVVEERQRTEAIKQLSFHEVAGLNNLAQLAQQAQQAFPELANVRTEQDLHNLHAQLQAQNPARAQQLAKADQVMRQRQVALANLTNQRKAHEAQQSQATAAQREAFRARQDADFEQRAERIVGAERWQQGRGGVKEAATKTLESAGLTRQQIHNLWHGQDSVDMHSAVIQELLLKASMWDSAQAKAQQIRQAPLPAVIKPGTSNSRASGSENVAELRARLRNSKGSDGIKLGVALLKAQRANRS
jgi:hypothetical protein